MKHVVVFVEGMADLPIPELQEQTPLEAASTPNLDVLAADGVVGRIHLEPPTPSRGPEASFFAFLGGPLPGAVPGRGGLEALAAGFPPGGHGRVASARLVTHVDGRLTDLAGGGLRDEETDLLMQSINQKVGAPDFRLSRLAGNRLLLWLGEAGGDLPDTTAPEFCLGHPYADTLPRGPGGERLATLVRASAEILEAEPVNRVRCDLQENPANLLWVWGVADVPLDRHWLETGTRKGLVVTEDYWAAGMALAFGHDPRGDMPGGVVSGVEALGSAAVRAVDTFDFVVAHVSSVGQCGLARDVPGKVRAIEELDRHVVGPLRRSLERVPGRLVVFSAWGSRSQQGRLLVGSNPLVVWGTDAHGGIEDRRFSERFAAVSGLDVHGGDQFREYFFADR